MVHFVKSVCSEIKSIARDFNQTDRFVKRENGIGKKTTRNYIPIGTGTLFKLNVLGGTALFALLIARGVTGCYRDENQMERIDWIQRLSPVSSRSCRRICPNQKTCDRSGKSRWTALSQNERTNIPEN